MNLKHTNKKSPGPGNYKPKNDLDKFGKYFQSNMKSSGACSFNPTTSIRFSSNVDKLVKIPGPGTYNPPEAMNKNGE